MVVTRRPLLIVSIGNTGAKYTNTYHSAGHILLDVLQRHPTASRFAEWTFTESPSLMNVSGVPVQRFYQSFVNQNPTGRMVVLHDELERELGWIGIKSGWSSAKGHRGILSIQAKLPKNAIWLRLAVGIGRPTSREPGDVSRYVLSKMKPAQIEKVEGTAEDALSLLRKIHEDKIPI